MGMYTGVRAKIIIKPEFREEFSFLDKEAEYEWSESNLDFLKEYGQVSRATFIPRGGLSYMPDEWELVELRDLGNVSVASDGFDRYFNKKNGIWTFQCSLKNYEDTIETFFENVLPKITESIIHLEKYYEEWDSSILYELKDGKIVPSDSPGITYNHGY